VRLQDSGGFSLREEWVFAEALSQAKVAMLRLFFRLMIGQRRRRQATVLDNFRYAIFDCKGAKSLTEVVALKVIRKMKVV
jgi:hypothetical protein